MRKRRARTRTTSRPALRIGAARVDEAAAYDAAQAVVETHRRLAAWLHAGLTLAEIDTFVAETLANLDSRSCFLHYQIPGLPPFPNHACLSVNDCIVHGTSGSFRDPLKPGDILKIDIGVNRNGWIGDAAKTYVFGEPGEAARRLMNSGKESMRRGLSRLQAGSPLIDWAAAVQGHVEGECGFHLVRGLGGHGYGRSLHAPPFVANTVPATHHEWPEAQVAWRVGTLVAVEPMIAVGTAATHQAPFSWPVYTADGSLAVHYEHDVLITANGPRILTAGLDEIPDTITR